VLAVLFLGVLMAALDIAIVAPALPAIREYFALDERTVAWVFNVFVLFNLVGVPLMARLSDGYGRRTVYLIDVSLFVLGALTVALAPTFAVLLVGRMLQGLGASGIFPVASAVVGDLFPPEKRGRTLGIIGAVFGLAFILGPMIGGILLQFGWRWLFVVALPLGAVVLGWSWRVLPNTRAPQAARLDVRGMVTLGLLLSCFAVAVNQIDAEAILPSLVSWRVGPLLLGALLLVPVFIAAERRAEAPLLRLELFRSRQVVLASLFAIGAGLTEASFVFVTGLAIAAFGVSKSAASFMLLPLVVAVFIGSPIAGRLLDRLGSRTIILSGTSLLAAGLGVMGLASETRPLFYTGTVLIGLGLSCLLGSALSYILLNEARVAERTVAQGVVTLFISIGQLTGGALIGAVVASAGGGASGYQGAFLVIAVVAVGLLIAGLGLQGRSEERAAAYARHAEE
jgi:multidrug resistance protein